jgi:hypothetical protein
LFCLDSFQKILEENIEYLPQSFDANHQGKEKKDLNPWQILLTPDDVIPRAIAEKKPKEYLEILRKEQESGFTPEDWITYAITKLEEEDTVVDNYANGIDSISYNVGAYFKDSDSVPYAYWVPDFQQASLYRSFPDFQVGSVGCRSAVRG